MASNITVPTDIFENLRWRAQLLSKAASDVKLAGALKKLYHDDPVFAFKAFFYTYDPRPTSRLVQQYGTHKFPFILWDYQVDALYQLLYHIDKGKDVLIYKARDMGISWLVTSIFLWLWSKNEPGYDFLLGSRKEDLVDKKGRLDTLFGKVRYNLYCLPNWLLPLGFEQSKHDTHMNIINPESGCVIQGEANNQYFGTGGRYRSALLDEYAKWEHTDSAAWTSLADATPCRIPLSTPAGRNNKYADLYYGVDGNKIDILDLPYNLHPFKDKEWYSAESLRRSPQEIAQEVDRSFEGSAGQRFFQEYNPSIHQNSNIDIIPGREVLVGFDFGYHHPAMLASQIDVSDHWLWQRVIMGKEVDIETFAKYCWKRLNSWYPDCEFKFYADIAGTQTSDKKNVKTSIQILRDCVEAPIIYRKIDRDNINTRIRELLNTNILGQPSLMIGTYKPEKGYSLPSYIEREDMGLVHEGFVGGIHYPESDRGQKEDWKKDGYFEHPFDAAGFIVANKFMSNSRPSKRLAKQEIINEVNSSTQTNQRELNAGLRNNLIPLGRYRKPRGRFGQISAVV